MQQQQAFGATSASCAVVEENAPACAAWRVVVAMSVRPQRAQAGRTDHRAVGYSSTRAGTDILLVVTVQLQPRYALHHRDHLRAELRAVVSMASGAPGNSRASLDGITVVVDPATPSSFLRWRRELFHVGRFVGFTLAVVAGRRRDGITATSADERLRVVREQPGPPAGASPACLYAAAAGDARARAGRSLRVHRDGPAT